MVFILLAENLSIYFKVSPSNWTWTQPTQGSTLTHQSQEVRGQLSASLCKGYPEAPGEFFNDLSTSKCYFFHFSRYYSTSTHWSREGCGWFFSVHPKLYVSEAGSCQFLSPWVEKHRIWGSFVILTKSHEQNPLILNWAHQNCSKFLENAPNLLEKVLN